MTTRASSPAQGSPDLYHQDFDLRLLLRLFALLEERTAIDVGAEKGSFVERFVGAGATQVFAFEPYPAHAASLRERFRCRPEVRVLEMAIGRRDEEAKLHVAVDPEGKPYDYYHSLIRFEATETTRWDGVVPVTSRSLGSLVADGTLPSSVGVLKVDTEGSNADVVAGMGELRPAVLMVEFWDGIPHVFDHCPYTVREIADELRTRGYSHFAVIRRHDEYLSMGIDDARSRPGDWGNAIFVHDRVFPAASAVVCQAASEAHEALIDQAIALKRVADERLDVIDELKHTADERLEVIAELRRAADERLEVIDELKGAADERLEMIDRLKRVDDDRLRAIDELKHTADERLEAIDELRRVAEQRLGMIAELERAAEQQASAARPAPIVAAIARSLARARGILQAARARKTIFFTPKLGNLIQYPPRPLRLARHIRSARLLGEPPVISIVTPSYNQAPFLERTLRSVLDQGYPALEYIVQDGGSTDGSIEILERYRERLHSLESERDGGQAAGINRGFRHATGEILAYLNSDDLLLPGSLHYVARFFTRHPEIDVVYGQRILIDENDQEIGRWILPPHDDEVLSWADYVPQESLFWRRSAWGRVGGQLDESLQFAMDWDLLLRFRTAGLRFARAPRFLGAFRVHAHQKTVASLADLGLFEMGRLREQVHGRTVTDDEIGNAIQPYLKRHLLCHKLHRLGVYRF
jgi:FkbM family methyltransferase